MPRSLELLDWLCHPAGTPPAVVIVAAHPDDEVLGAGGRLAALQPQLIVHTTDGAPHDMQEATAAGCATRQEYALLRRRELVAALALVGIPPERTRQIGVVDQEASFHLADLSRALAGIILEVAPKAVLTHAYEGGHPDHDATAFAVSAACSILQRDGRPVPVPLEFCGYHDRDGAWEPGEFAPLASCGRSAMKGELRLLAPFGRSAMEAQFLPPPAESIAGPEPAACRLRLSPGEQESKRRMLACFASQRHVLELLSVEIEHYRAAPRHAFMVPPHPGTLLYERYPWGMSGRLWRSLAADALRELDLDPRP